MGRLLNFHAVPSTLSQHVHEDSEAPGNASEWERLSRHVYSPFLTPSLISFHCSTHFQTSEYVQFEKAGKCD